MTNKKVNITVTYNITLTPEDFNDETATRSAMFDYSEAYLDDIIRQIESVAHLMPKEITIEVKETR